MAKKVRLDSVKKVLNQFDPTQESSWKERMDFLYDNVADMSPEARRLVFAILYAEDETNEKNKLIDPWRARRDPLLKQNWEHCSWDKNTMPHLFHLYSEFISQDEEQADKLTSLDKSKARVELRDYAPLDEMRTTCKSRVRYAEQGFNQFVFLDRLKESIKDLHQPTPRALIFTQTSAANRSFLIKEAFKNAFPDEKIPVFLTVNVKPIRYNKKPHYNRQLRDFDKQNPELVENISQEIRRKLKDYGIKEGEVIVVDEFPASDYSYSDNNGCGRYEVPRTGSTLQIATDIVRKATMLEGLNVKVRSYNFMPLSQWNPNFAYGPWIKYHNDDTRCDRANTPEERQISRKNIAYLKSIGKVVGLQIKEEDRNKSLEQKVSGATALVGILGGSIFVGSNFTGNTIVNLSNSTFSWIGGVLFCVGLVGAFFWIRSKRR